ncbi:MAG: T9SS type A sorting domain-containing protein [Flavobacteriales bacterium]|nr:T9SS type A sorting domain-containing protein [Flavobacteriales bacterium]
MRHTTLTVLAILSLGAYAQPGALDTAFGNNGKVLVPTLGLGQNDQAVTGVVLPDDRIVVVGRSSNGTHINTVLLRFNTDGSPDATFGTNGVVEHDLGPGSEFPRSSTLDAQGRLVVGGQLFSDAAETNSDMFVARFLADGSLDPDFNGTGLLVRDIHGTPDAEEAREVLVQADGKIVLMGFTGPALEFTEIVAERYLDNGGLDPAFGGDGSVLVSIANATGEQVRGAVLGPVGEILFCGFGFRTGETDESLLMGRLQPDGNLASTYGSSSGYSWVSNSGSGVIGRTVALLSWGGTAVAGVQQTSGSTQARTIHAFSPNGLELDELIENDPDGSDGWLSLLAQNNGTFIAGGHVPDGPGARNWNVQRYTYPGLAVDPLFITADYDEDGGNEECNHLIFFSDSSIIAIGNAEVSGLNHIGLLKYQNDLTSSLAEGAHVAVASAYPNPTADRTIITMPAGTKGAIDLLLMDAQGRLVRNWSRNVAGTGNMEVDLSDLVPGVYGLRMIGTDPHTTLKLVKQ